MFGAENNINRTRFPGFPPYSMVPSESKSKCSPAKFSRWLAQAFTSNDQREDGWSAVLKLPRKTIGYQESPFARLAFG